MNEIGQIVQACIKYIRENSPYCAEDVIYSPTPRGKGVIVGDKPCVSGQERFICRIDFNVDSIEISNCVTPGTPILYAHPNMLDLMLQTITTIATK